MSALLCLLAGGGLVAGYTPGHLPRGCAQSRHTAVPRLPAPLAQFGFKVQKSERLLIREAWEKADAYRPGKPNWFTKKQEDLVELHKTLAPEYKVPTIPPPTNATSLLGALLKVLTTGDLALTLCSPEPPVLTQLRDWLVETMPMEEAVLGLPEEQGRVLSVLVRALDARRILDLGTFTGYSSIAMALAAADDARVLCAEPDMTAARSARDWWLKAGVSTKTRMFECGAESLLDEIIGAGGAGSIDMVFCDVGERERYPHMHEQLMQVVRVGGLVVYYDTLWAADEINTHPPFPTMRKFVESLAKDPRVIATMVPLSYGFTLCVKAMDLPAKPLEQALAADASGDSAALVDLLKARREEVEAELKQMD